MGLTKSVTFKLGLLKGIRLKLKRRLFIIEGIDQSLLPSLQSLQLLHPSLPPFLDLARLRLQPASTLHHIAMFSHRLPQSLFLSNDGLPYSLYFDLNLVDFTASREQDGGHLLPAGAFVEVLGDYLLQLFV
jgi:hypothetical protein